MGYIHRWARLGALAPRLFNLVTHLPGVSMLVKSLGGISTSRDVPRFAERTFTAWFQGRANRSPRLPRSSQSTGGMRVVLWADTFNNHFHPETAMAATKVLERAGCDVIVPPESLCCGRPLYDYGLLVEAKALLRRVLVALQPHLEAGTPIVVLEPSCLAVFRDELVNLFPEDEDAKRLSRQAVLLSEFLHSGLRGYRPPPLDRHVMLHGHCHHKAIATLDAEEAILREMGVELDAPDSGCCGMAGSFGFEAQHYDVSMKVGELVLLPAVRQAAPDTLIVADGFSCREQIAQATSRRAVHLAEALQLAASPRAARDGGVIENAVLPPQTTADGARRNLAAAALVAAGIGLSAAAAWRSSRR